MPCPGTNITYQCNKTLNLHDMVFNLDYTVTFIPAAYSREGMEYPAEYEIEIDRLLVSNDGKNQVDITGMVSEFVTVFDYLHDEIIKRVECDIDNSSEY